MRKLQGSLGLALVGGTLTTIFALLNDVRLLTVLHRALFSTVLLGAIGYLLIGIIERRIIEPFIVETEAKVVTKGQNIDITSEDVSGEVESVKAPDTDKEFSPFMPEHFDRISNQGQ
ncbi:MAG: hypothetical protein H6Q73_2497 [Firmicutes bacterium]|nr:hypothetical protein [Bacillota bacterium]